MADERQLSILLKDGVTAWNKWRNEDPLTHPDLTGVNFPRARLDGANLKNTNLSGALFGKCQLADVDFTNAVLASARFYGCQLERALFNGILASHVSFDRSYIREGNLSGSTFWHASFDGAVLESAKFNDANLSYSSFRNTNLRKADLTRANLTCASFVNTEFEDASLEGSLVYGVSVWNARLAGAKQYDLVITPEHQPRITIDNLEVAQFVYLLLNNERIRDVVGTIARKAVLILGCFQERKEILDAIANALRQRDLLPIIFDFETPRERDFTETIKILAGLSKFVVADITSPRSVPLELQATVPDYMIPFVPIIQKGETPFSMFKDLQTKYDWVLSVFEYDTKETLLSDLDDKVIQPALAMHDQLVSKKAIALRMRSK